MELELRNVGIIKTAHLEFIQGLNLIVGSSSSGKSTLLRAIRCMMDNSFSDSNISYGQKKLAIRMIYNGHSATYIRDLDNTSRKSAYQVDGKVYTKVGRTSLEDLSKIFKLSPVEIDCEKINFNFSSQFSGPFLLLGSPSLLYSILTYRSSFDITKINDLYFADYKKVKQDISVLMKTKESLDKEKEQKEAELQKMESFPTDFLRVQKLKQQYETFQKQESIYTSYKNTIEQIEVNRKKIKQISEILRVYSGYNSNLEKYKLLFNYTSSLSQVSLISNTISELKGLHIKVADILPEFEYVRVLRLYITLRDKIDTNRDILKRVNIQDSKVVELLQKYSSITKDISDKRILLQDTQTELERVSASILEVGVCPLCKQPLY